MHIKKYLKDGVRYYGCDYRKREADTIVCDLAVGEFPDIDVDTIFMAGVLEYLSNWEDVIGRICEHCKDVVISYSTSEEAYERDPRWVNNISKNELVMCFKNSGFILIECRKVTFNSLGFHFVAEES